MNSLIRSLRQFSLGYRRMRLGCPPSMRKSRITIRHPTSIFGRARPIWRICAIACYERCAAGQIAAPKIPRRCGGLRRRSAALSVPRNRLVEWRRSSSPSRQPHKPRRDVGSARGHSHGRATGVGIGRRVQHSLMAKARRLNSIQPRRRSTCSKGGGRRTEEPRCGARYSASARGFMGWRENTPPDQYPARRRTSSTRMRSMPTALA